MRTIILSLVISSIVINCHSQEKEKEPKKPVFEIKKLFSKDVSLRNARMGHEVYLPKDGPIIVGPRWTKNQCLALDPTSGKEVWERHGLCLVPKQSGEDVIIMEQGDDLWMPFGQDGEKMQRVGGIGYPWDLVILDPATGKEKRKKRLPYAFMSEIWYRQGNALIVASSSAIVGFDIRSGEPLWQLENSKICKDKAQFSETVHFTDTEMIIYCIQAGTHLRVDLESGKIQGIVDIWGLHTTYGPFVYFMHKQTLVAQRADKKIWEKPQPKGHEIRTVLASASYVVIMSERGEANHKTYRLAAYDAEKGQLVWEQYGKPEEEYYAYVSLSGDLLAYYSSLDTSERIRRLPGGPEKIYRKHNRHVAFGPDAAGMVPAVPSGPPLLDPPHLIAVDWSMVLYNIRIAQ